MIVVYLTCAILLGLVGLVIDVGCFWLGLRRLRGEGPSGIPLVSLMFYAASIGLFWLAFDLTFATVRVMFYVSIALHVVLQFVLLLAVHIVFVALRR